MVLLLLCSLDLRPTSDFTRILQWHVYDDLITPPPRQSVGADGDHLNHVATVGQQAGDYGALGKNDTAKMKHSNNH